MRKRITQGPTATYVVARVEYVPGVGVSTQYVESCGSGDNRLVAKSWTFDKDKAQSWPLFKAQGVRQRNHLHNAPTIIKLKSL
jgi:hypothetical protein